MSCAFLLLGFSDFEDFEEGAGFLSFDLESFLGAEESSVLLDFDFKELDVESFLPVFPNRGMLKIVKRTRLCFRFAMCYDARSPRIGG